MLNPSHSFTDLLVLTLTKLQLYGTVQKFDNDDDYYYYYYIPNIPTSGDLHIFTLKHYLIATS